MRIEPTIGRIVWFFPPIDGGRHEDGQPFGSLVAGVNDDGTINLLVAARDGSPYGAANIPLLQDGDAIDQDTAHAVWMPYQKGQAAKTEQLLGSTALPVDLQPVHDKIADAEKATQAKFEEFGTWLKNRFEDFDIRISAAAAAASAAQAASAPPAPAATPPAAPAPAGATEAQPNASAPGAAPAAATT
jgi:hypothetical protein